VNPLADSANPFAVLSLIVAPAILTNACSVLSLSTSNRLARAVDRARELAKQLEDPAGGAGGSETTRRLAELTAAEQRAVMLLGALRSFYVALGAFAAATFISALGAVLIRLSGPVVLAFELGAVATGAIAVAALVYGSMLLVRETRIAVHVIRDRAAAVRARVRG
jgi:hypothetical protein